MPDQPQTPPASQPVSKAHVQQQARNNAVEAVRALNQPEPAEPAEAPPPAAQPEAVKQPSGEGNPPAPQEPKAEAPEPKPEEPKGPPPQTWERLNQVEQELESRKKELESQTAALEAQKELLGRGQDLDKRLREDPLGLAQEYGWSDKQLAQILVARNQDGFPESPANRPVNAPANPPVSPFDERPAAPVEPQRDERVDGLINAVVELKWENELLRNPELEVLRSLPDGLNYALNAAAEHINKTGGNLTPAEGLAIAQERLIAEKKREIEMIRGNPTLSNALGLDRSSRTFDGLDESDAKPDGEPEQMTTITSTTAGTPAQPAVPQAANLSHEDRLERAVEAMRRAKLAR